LCPTPSASSTVRPSPRPRRTPRVPRLERHRSENQTFAPRGRGTHHLGSAAFLFPRPPAPTTNRQPPHKEVTPGVRPLRPADLAPRPAPEGRPPRQAGATSRGGAAHPPAAPRPRPPLAAARRGGRTPRPPRPPRRPVARSHDRCPGTLPRCRGSALSGPPPL